MPTTNQFTDEELGLDPTDLEGLDPNIRAEIRKNRTMAKQLAHLTESQERQERELAFYRAGVPADDKGAYFAAGYKGELDPTAIKAEFDKVFGSVVPTGDGNDGKTADQLAAEKRIADAGGEVLGNNAMISLEDAIKNAPDNAAVMEIIRNAPAEAGIRAAQ